MKYKTGDKFIVEIKAIPYGDDNAIYLIRSEDRELGVLTQWTLDRLEMVQEHDGCDGCKFVKVPKENYPCFNCKNNYTDKWERNTEEIQVGDEVENITGQRGVVTRIEKDEINTFYQVNKICFWAAENCFRTGKTYHELIKALEGLPKEGE